MSGMTEIKTTVALNNARSELVGDPLPSPLCEGPASNALPEARSSQTGVSVENALAPTDAPTDATNDAPATPSAEPTSEPSSTTSFTPPYSRNLRWFVLRVSYGRTVKAEQILKSKGIQTYNPLHRVVKMVRGKRRRVQQPLLPGFLFVHSEPTGLDEVMREVEVKALATYYYDHFRIGSNGYNPPLVVPDKSMESFMIAVNADSHDVHVVNPSNVHYKSGDKVRVAVGKFKGVEGRVARAKGQQRVIINVEGLCLVATAYIPTGCIEIVESAENTNS